MKDTVKAVAFVILGIMLLFFWHGGAVGLYAISEPTLAQQINKVISAINWASPSGPQNYQYATVTHKGAIFGATTSVASYEQAMQGYNSRGEYHLAIWTYRFAEMDGYSSSTLTQLLTTALNSIQFTSGLPITDGGMYLNYQRYTANAYRYAQQLGISRWDSATALSTVRARVTSLGNGPNIGYPNGWPSDYYRYYDSHAETEEWFMMMGSTSDAVTVWQGPLLLRDYNNDGILDPCDEQGFFWNGQYYGYNGKSGVETEDGPFLIIVAKLSVMNGGALQYFPDRLLSDQNYKMLSNGWSSPLWHMNNGSPSYVAAHAGQNQRRLQNTIGAVASLFIYYPLMSNAGKTATRALLVGGGSDLAGWKGLIEQSTLTDGTRFMMMDGTGYNDFASAMGAELLFLEGVVPNTGTIAVPLNEEYYEDTDGMFPATQFRFNYANQRIRLPIKAGSLTFQYGSTPASYTFAADGIYDIQFSSNWNTVSSVSLVGPLDTTHFQYLGSSSSPPQKGTITVHTTANGQPISTSITAVGTTTVTFSTVNGVGTSPQLDYGTYTVSGTYNSITRTTSATIPTSSDVSLDFTSGGGTNVPVSVQVTLDSLQTSGTIEVTKDGTAYATWNVGSSGYSTTIPYGTYSFKCVSSGKTSTQTRLVNSQTTSVSLTFSFTTENPNPPFKIPREIYFFSGVASIVVGAFFFVKSSSSLTLKLPKKSKSRHKYFSVEGLNEA